LALWLLGCAVPVWIIAHAHFRADLSAFLPEAPSTRQALLIEQIRIGPASRLVLAAISGGDAADRARMSGEMARRLRQDSRFEAVFNGDASRRAADQAFFFSQRFVLSERVGPALFRSEGLHEALAEGVNLLASPLGVVGRDLYVHDPTAETLQVLSQLGVAGGSAGGRPGPRIRDGVWISGDGKEALLVLHTRATGADTDAQQSAMAAIRTAFEQSGGRAAADAEAVTSGTLTLSLSGPGVFSVEVRARIEREALRLSILSSLLIAALLVMVYRSLFALLLGLSPVVSGALVGVAAVAIGFEAVHALTLGFGVTLIGEAVDYSIYLFIQGQRDAHASAGMQHRFWPTLSLGMLTSVAGFASMVPSSFPGLAQLGVYSIAGLVAALLVTRYLLPGLGPVAIRMTSIERLGRACIGVLARLQRWRWLAWTLPLLASGFLITRDHTVWDRQLSSLSPVPAASLALDARLRRELGAPEVRSLVIASGVSREAALQGAEAAAAVLTRAVGRGEIGGFQSPSRFLPSEATQAARRASLPDGDTLRARLLLAAQSLPIRVETLAPFVADVEAARVAAPLTAEDLALTSAASALDLLLVRQGERWNALMPLEPARDGARVVPIDLEPLREALARTAPSSVDLQIVDLKAESDALYAAYLDEAWRLSLAGLIAIILLLALTLRAVKPVLRVVLPLIGAVLVVAAGLVVAQQALTILHLIGFLLVVAVGSNYALFFNAGAGPVQLDSKTVASLVIANLATVIGFAVLASSSVPVLSAIGSSVAPGTLLALILSAMMARPVSPAADAATGAGKVVPQDLSDQ
jgi:predicted exporter